MHEEANSKIEYNSQVVFLETMHADAKVNKNQIWIF